MLVSRLNPTRYPWADPDVWVDVPATAKRDLIDPVFLGRVAALARAKGKKITLTPAGGARDTATQARLYATLPAGQAARPGTSWHEYGLAIDAADAWVQELHRLDPTDGQKVLLQYGLFKPMSVGNKPAVVEDWHIQPIETRNIAAHARATMSPMSVPIDTKTFQTVRGLTPDGKEGPKTNAEGQRAYWGQVCG